MSNEVKSVTAHEIECPNCGAHLTYDIDSGNLKCTYCNCLIPLNRETGDNYFSFSDFIQSSNKNEYNQENQVIHCKSCGGSTVLNKYQISKSCSFCGSNYVVCLESLPGIKPHYIVPFSINEETAHNLLKKWQHRLFWAPKKFKRISFVENFHSIYLPYWNFQVKTNSNYNADRGTYYYVKKVTTINGKRHVTNERKVRYTFVSGVYDKVYSNIQISASSSFNQNILSKIGRFNTINLIEFDETFLAGFDAERYSIDLEQGFINAKFLINTYINNDIRSHIGGDEIRNLKINTNYEDILFRLILVPVHHLSIQYNKKLYQFSINGQNGKVFGKNPISVVKIIVAVFISLIILFIFFISFL